MKAFLLRRNLASLLLAGSLLSSSTGCSTWKIAESMPTFNSQARREQEIARRAKSDPFPSAGNSAKKPL